MSDRQLPPNENPQPTHDFLTNLDGEVTEGHPRHEIITNIPECDMTQFMESFVDHEKREIQYCDYGADGIIIKTTDKEANREFAIKLFHRPLSYTDTTSLLLSSGAPEYIAQKFGPSDEYLPNEKAVRSGTELVLLEVVATRRAKEVLPDHIEDTIVLLTHEDNLVGLARNFIPGEALCIDDLWKEWPEIETINQQLFDYGVYLDRDPNSKNAIRTEEGKIKFIDIGLSTNGTHSQDELFTQVVDTWLS